MEQQGNVKDDGRPLVSRRSVALGAAWSVPVIVLATAAPAAAASGNAPQVTVTVVADKVPVNQFGTKKMNFVMTLANTGTAAATVAVLSVTSDKTSGTMVDLPTTVTVPVGGSVPVSFSYTYAGDAGTATYTISYRTNSGPVQIAQITA